MLEIADWKAAQALGDGCSIRAWHAGLDALARQDVPLRKQFPNGYQWRLRPVE